jgi:hypothetical protein
MLFAALLTSANVAFLTVTNVAGTHFGMQSPAKKVLTSGFLRF